MVELFLLIPLEAHPPQAHAQQFRPEDAPLAVIQSLRLVIEGFKSSINILGLGQTTAEGHHRRLLLLVGLA